MIAQTELPSLDQRSRTLFKTLVERYIRDGQPVGSRTLADTSGLSVSAATVRNVLADLEDKGFLAAPHTSAGRIPTVRGYRFFIDTLLSPEPLHDREVADLERELRTQNWADGSLLNSVSTLLSSLSDMAGVVTVPRRGTTSLRQIEFLPLSPKRVLAVLVINQREVQNRIIETDRVYTASQLEQAANFLNSRFSGLTLPQIRSKLLSELNDARAHINQEIRDALAMAKNAFDENKRFERGDYVLAGQTNLMSFPEFGEVGRLRILFDALQQKRDLLALFDNTLSAEGVQIFIGDESGYRVLDECSVVSASYTVDGEVVGTLGVIGPTRMAYSRIIPLVDATATLLGSALKSSN